MSAITRRLIVWGASGHARVVADAALATGAFTLAGFIDDVDAMPRIEPLTGRPVFGGVEALDQLRADGVDALVVGFGDGPARLRAAAQAAARGFELATIVHPRACVSPYATLGPGVVVVAGAVVGPGTRVDANVIVNASSSIDHDCAIGEGAHIGPGAHLAGNVRVGRVAWVGIGASVKEGVSIGEGAVVGAGAVVVRDVPARMVAYGVPARAVREVTG